MMCCDACEYHKCDLCQDAVADIQTTWNEEKEDPIPDVVHFVPVPEMRRAKFWKVLSTSSHQGKHFGGAISKCAKLLSLRIVSVEEVHNPFLWQKFSQTKRDMKKRH